MTTWILVVLGLYFVQTMMPALFRYVLTPDPQIAALLGPRDTPPEDNIYSARADRALRNTGEALLMFLPLALLSGETSGALLGAQIFAVARIAYVPAYVLGIPVLRSLIWTAGVGGMVLMVLDLMA